MPMATLQPLHGIRDERIPLPFFIANGVYTLAGCRKAYQAAEIYTRYLSD
jgi:hypothetical protein